MAEILWIQEERHPGQGQPEQRVDPVRSCQHQPQAQFRIAMHCLVRILQDVAEVVLLRPEPSA